jgi:hypothetical protein
VSMVSPTARPQEPLRGGAPECGPASLPEGSTPGGPGMNEAGRRIDLGLGADPV